MNWFDWFLVGWFALNAVLNVASVGKERTPLTAGTAATIVVVMGLLIAGVIYFHWVKP